MRLDELSFECVVKDALREILLLDALYVRLVLFFISETHNQTNYKCLLEFVYADNAS